MWELPPAGPGAAPEIRAAAVRAVPHYIISLDLKACIGRLPGFMVRAQHVACLAVLRNSLAQNVLNQATTLPLKVRRFWRLHPVAVARTVSTNGRCLVSIDSKIRARL